MSNEEYFARRFLLIKKQEEVCFKLLKNAGVFLGNDQAFVTNDYGLDVRNRFDNRNLLDIKVGKTLFIQHDNPLPNEQDFYYLKEKTFNKYCEWADKEDFYVALFHCFFWEEEEKLTKRYNEFAKKKFLHQMKIEKELSCLLVGVNNLRNNLKKCSKKIQLHKSVAKNYLKFPDADNGCILKIDSGSVGVRLNLRNYWADLTPEEQQILMTSA